MPIVPTLLAAVLVAVVALAEDEPAPSAPETKGLEALGWIAGRWVQEREGEFLEETWGPPVGDSMVGMFRWVRGGRCGLYELLAIERDDDRIVLRLRHFNRGLEPWASEAKTSLTYPLVRQARSEAVFEDPEATQPRRFVYRFEDGRLEVRMEGPDGRGMSFRFARAP